MACASVSGILEPVGMTNAFGSLGASGCAAEGAFAGAACGAGLGAGLSAGFGVSEVCAIAIAETSSSVNSMRIEHLHSMICAPQAYYGLAARMQGLMPGVIWLTGGSTSGLLRDQ